MDFKIKFDVKDWLKFGAVYGFLYGILIALIITFAANLIKLFVEMSGYVGFTLSLVAILFAIAGGMVQVFVGRYIYQLFNLKMKDYWRFFTVIFFGAFLINLIMARLSIDLGMIIATLVATLVFSFVTMKVYDWLDWRYPY